MAKDYHRQPIAIIGLGLRLPGADDLDTFWAHLAAEQSLISPLPIERFDPETLAAEAGRGAAAQKIWGGFIENADGFDADFFGISPREAAWMDPQQRFALEMSWHAIEDAGYDAAKLAGSRTGVFMGVCHWDYAELIEKHLASVDAYTPTGMAYSIIANRISHFFDFRGPSITNDTACAASLTSVYEAVRAIQGGTCDMALAGGVNLIWSPNHFSAFSKAGMLSKDGRSKAFEDSADGYVRGEGGAVLCLKLLSAAIQDGDPIHAVIRGVDINHGGRTNSLTVTNPEAQADLIMRVQRDADVTPDQIEFIEAHGTGTPLGDPIEVSGLKQAFALRAAETEVKLPERSCGIGSVKTNIGHLEGAAGVAGIVKVLAALKFEQLPPNVGFTELNRLIDLSGTPFYLQSHATDWPRQYDKSRIAGVSSFGFGGSNAHALIEDAPNSRMVPNRDDMERDDNATFAILLSAVDDERLRITAERLIQFIENAEQRAISIADVAHTYQVARSQMACRCVLVVRDIRGLLRGLQNVVNLQSDIAGCVLGDDPDQGSNTKYLAQVEAAETWVARDDLEWPQHLIAKGNRIHLPLYPFRRDRHWMDMSLSAKAQNRIPHPLLHVNKSDFSGVVFETRLSGDEFVLKDHLVGANQVLPGVVGLEMARAASALSGAIKGPGFAIENIVWAKPIQRSAKAALVVETGLQKQGEDRFEFTLRTVSSDPGTSAPAIVGGRRSGQANLQGTIKHLQNAILDTVGLDTLRQKIDRRRDTATCYERLRASGVEHGSAFRALAQVTCSQGEVLARLKIPRRLTASLAEMPLHPVLLDAAIQAWVAMEETAPTGPAVPFACKRIAVFGPCEPAMWAHVRLKSKQAVSVATREFDIDLMNESGQVLVRFEDLTLRLLSLKKETHQVDTLPDDLDHTLVAPVEWTDVPLKPQLETMPVRTKIVLAGMAPDLADLLASQTGWLVETIDEVSDANLGGGVGRMLLSLHRIVQDGMRARGSEDVRYIVLVNDAVTAVASGSLAGLLKTAAIENPKISGRVIRLAGDMSPDRLCAIAFAEASSRDTFFELRYDETGGRHALLPQPLDGSINECEAAIDPDGVYWITGGLGGLGLIFAEWLISRGARKIALSGRRADPAPETAEKLRELQNLDADIRYFVCDISERAQADEVASAIIAEQGALRGVIHAAGVANDGYILNQDVSQSAGVFGAKIDGTLNLDQVTQASNLDFFMMCSTVASVFGNPGQAFYAGANAFMDGFAEQRAKQVAAGLRHGKTLSISWPLWEDGGMSVDAATKTAMERRLGLRPMPTIPGLSALDAALTDLKSPRVLIMHGQRQKMLGVLGEIGQSTHNVKAPQYEKQTPQPAPVATIDDEALLQQTIAFVRGIVAAALEMEPEAIRPNRQLEEYGLDSITIVESTTGLEEALGPLSKTLFFEYVDIAGVSAHLISEKRAALQEFFAQDVHGATQEAAFNVEDIERSVSQPDDVVTFVAQPLEAVTVPAESNDLHDIAIVGLSLRVANASDQDAFWQMLSQGIHGFEPVPKARWDNDALHHPERDILGKTVVKTGAFLPDIDKFDPRYFRISQAEAELMSPEVRLFLEASVEAFEDAGYSRETLAAKYGGEVAVIVGSMTNEYDLFGFESMLTRGSLASGSYTGTVPNMVSYYYGFTGPSYFLDTMCSAASTCVHEAVHMLRAGRCAMALAGGVNVLLHPQKLIATSQEHFTTKSAYVIRGYGIGAEGTILGEGVGALVLKPLVDAQRDGDHVYGVIVGTGISNAGVRNGFTVPNPNQQAVAIERAFEDASITPDTITYVEGHGSGTALGDPIEIKALTQVYRKYTDTVQTCPIGTVKSNVAHLLGASGLAGIVKVLAQLKHAALAPSLHAEKLNPDIPFETSPFFVQRELTPWKRLVDASGTRVPRRAGITSIGAGGMNSHILIEEHPKQLRLEPPDEPELLVFSAMTSDRLREVLKRFKTYLERETADAFSDIAFTLQVGKNELPCRMAFVANDISSALETVVSFLGSDETPAEVIYEPSILNVDPPKDNQQLRLDCEERNLARVAVAWCAGAKIDWDLLNRNRTVRRVSLPAYPFEKIRCWYQSQPDAPSVLNPIGSRTKLHPLIGMNSSTVDGLTFTTKIYLSELRDYVFKRSGVEDMVPLVAVDAVAAAARVADAVHKPAVKNLHFNPIATWTDIDELVFAVKPSLTVHHDNKAQFTVQIDVITKSGKSQTWVVGDVEETTNRRSLKIDLPAIFDAAEEVLDADGVYSALRQKSYDFSPYIESIEQAWRCPDGRFLFRLCADQPQQDFFKKNTDLDACALGAGYQALIFATFQESDCAIHSIDAVDFSDDSIDYVYYFAEPEGTWSVQFLNANGDVVSALSGVSVGVGFPAAAIEKDRVKPIVADTPQVTSILIEELRIRVAEILKFAASDIGVRENFHDLGFDSISLARFAKEISTAYGIDLSPALFFECEHLAALSDYMIERFGITPLSETPARSSGSGPLTLNTVKTAERAAPMRAPRHETVEKPVRLLDDAVADDRIAIIGMAGRFPQSPDVETFIDNLLAGRDLTTDFPISRYSPSYQERIEQAKFAKHGGFLEDIDRFDAAFFKISPHEAERMDPQQRLLLETAWQTLEDAGYLPEDLPQKTGVFVGITSLDYAALWRDDGHAIDGYVSTGNSLAMAANRISHFFNIHGPSQAIDTACSSSLIAILHACDALRAGQCKAAMAGAANLCLSLEGFEGPHQAGMLSPDGRCKTFGDQADGYARGEGVGVLLLKRLREAERDGDRIHGVIIGGAENHGGYSGALTAPNAKSQAQLIMDAMSGINPHSVSYIEAHGTGTELGDPVEVNGLCRAYQELSSNDPIPQASIGLGTVKSNIGHLEAAAGIAGVIKVIMAMRRRELPKTLHATPTNPHIQLTKSPFRVLAEHSAWPDNNNHGALRAGISSFGFGGTNAHVVLENYTPTVRASRQPLPPKKFANSRFWLPNVQREGPLREKMLFGKEWQGVSTSGTAFVGRKIVVGCGMTVDEIDDADVRHIYSREMGMAGTYVDAAKQLLRLLQSVLVELRADQTLLQLVVPSDSEGYCYSGLASMLKTASAEEPHLRTQLIEIPNRALPSDISDWVRDEATAQPESHVSYRNGQRSIPVWYELSQPQARSAWRDHGVYLIAGGFGGLGRLVAEDIAQATTGAAIILTGTKPIDAERLEFIEKLRNFGANAAYRHADVSDAKIVTSLIQQICEAHGQLHGIIHCAGTLRDGFIASKSEADLEAVLAPKVHGVIALCEATADLDLDLFVLFSSLAGSFGNAGQADYAAANGFMDALAQSSQQRITSINWPLWQDGGMRVDEATKAAFFERMGQRPLATGPGIEALQACIASDRSQIAVVAGDEARIGKFFEGNRSGADNATYLIEANVNASLTHDDLSQLLTEKLRHLFSEISGVRVTDIYPQTPLEDVGIDSLMITILNDALGGIFIDLPKTLFFRYRSLQEISDYLIGSQSQACIKWVAKTNNERSNEPRLVGSEQGENDFKTAKHPEASNSVVSHDEPIAVIGISGTYPDAPTLDIFWGNLERGHDAVREIPRDRWSLQGFFEPNQDEAALAGKSYSKWGAFLDGFADFDPLFFKISPRDAAAMDPHERLFLISAWQAMEDAGYSTKRLKQVAGQDHDGARVGVFVGVTKTGFALHGEFKTEEGARVRPSTSFASIANRVSFVLGLSGPSMPIDTMCSSSLTAIHEACAHLRANDCTMAFAGGVNLYLHPSNYIELSAAQMLSPTGKCRSFGANADGFVPGEGVGCVVLKPLSRALADGDRIHALIRGSAVNHGGRTNGYSVPNPVAQKDLIRRALEAAGVCARDISYIEAHGTGTALGDPIELDGLSEAFAMDATEQGACSLGSVKSSIGHLEAAAGIAGFTKIILQMKHRRLAPTLHAEKVNPDLDFAKTPFRLQKSSASWLCDGPLRAGISSFGAGGSNAHVILEEVPRSSAAAQAGADAPAPQVIVLSARDDDRLRAYAASLLEFVRRSDAGVEATIDAMPQILNEICASLGEILEVDQSVIDPIEDFRVLGLDAMQVAAFIKWIKEAHDVVLNRRDFDYAGSLNDWVAAIASEKAVPPGHIVPYELQDIAYTLQVGRDPMSARLAILVHTTGELEQALDDWLSDKTPDVAVFCGNQSTAQNSISSTIDDETIGDVISKAWENQNFETVMRLWVDGAEVAWQELRGAASLQIVSLPTYPFKAEKYWVPNLVDDESDSPSRVNSEMRSLMAGYCGDQALQSEQDALENEISRLLGAILPSVTEQKIINEFRPWAEAANRLLEPQNGGQLNVEAAWQQWDLWKKNNSLSAQITLAEETLRKLPEILVGDCIAVSALFPQGRQSLVEAVYKQNPVARRFSDTLAVCVAQYLAISDEDEEKARSIKILEIGAGMGGTSEPIFDALTPFADRIAEYAYTDVSKAFLIHAERTYSDHVPNLRTLLFNVENPLAEQGIVPGTYDIVIAANVLHATTDIVDTLSRVHELLSPDGMLFLNETSKPTLFTHVTFGLLGGWWRFSDPEYRIPGTPSLTVNKWQEALSQVGFEWSTGSTSEERMLGQQIVVAKAGHDLANDHGSTEKRINTKSAKTTVAFDAQKVSFSAKTPPQGNHELEILLTLREALAETLNVRASDINDEMSFADYGLDSILGAEFIHRLRGALGIELDQTVLFDHTNAARLTAYIGDAFAHELSVLTNLKNMGQQPPLYSAVTDDDQSATIDRKQQPIAIVGASGRFAKSATIDELWEHLVAGHDLVEPVSRFDLAAFYSEDELATVGRHGSFIDGIDEFDPMFFGISGLEATYMDPQQRLFLAEAWKTLESAGHAGEDMQGRRCGVFVGCAHGDYQDLFADQPPGQAFWGNTTSLIPARISYWLDLKGPAVAVDTACSSSLVALHMACQSIHTGECDMALAGGVFVQCSPRFFRYANAAKMLSPSGRCAAFGSDADGIVPGEAVGAVLLRPLADAIDDGDTILGVIAGSGTNQDGTTNGITAPSAASQERLINQVYQDFGIDPESIDVVEAHGTGTPLGDPIEHNALVRALSKIPPNGRKRYLGSVKSNIGHATTAAGIAGLAKVLWSFKHETVAPSLHFKNGNPGIDFAGGPFVINTSRVPWPRGTGAPRRAAISSFGFSGTNAHVVVEEPPTSRNDPELLDTHIVVLSARTEEQLKRQVERLAAHVQNHPELSLDDLAFTLMSGRRHLDYRFFVVSDSCTDLTERLMSWLSGNSVGAVKTACITGSKSIPQTTKVDEVALFDASQRRDALDSLGCQFLAGALLEPKLLFTQKRRRIPLPTYPFENKSYWVAPEKPVTKNTSSGADTEFGLSRAADAVTALPTKIALSEAAFNPLDQSQPVAVKAAKISLAPLGMAETKAMIERKLDPDGVLTLNVTNAWSRDHSRQLLSEIEQASQNETVRVILLTGNMASIGSSESDHDCLNEAELYKFLQCRMPIVADLPSSDSIVTSPFVVFADFVVAEKMPRLGRIADAMSEIAERIYGRRLQEFCPLLGDSGAARNLARNIARAPREALALLKDHMRRVLPPLMELGRISDAAFPVTSEAAPSLKAASSKVVMEGGVVELEAFDDGIVCIHMNEREGRNMFTPALMVGLEHAFAKITELRNAKVVVLTGHGPYFACGGTAEGLAELQKGDGHFTDRRIYSLPLECELPVIAAMQGHAIGAGWSLGMYCDHAVFAEESIYHSNYLWFGFTPGAGATLIFPERLGDDLGREVLFTAQEYKGQELKARSNRVHALSARGVLPSALEMARALAVRTRDELISEKTTRVVSLRRNLDFVLQLELAMHEKTFIGNDDVQSRIDEKFAVETNPPDRPLETNFNFSTLTAELKASLADDLMIDASDINDGDAFLDLGLDSILAVTWIRSINERFEVQLPATAVYAYPTFDDLKAHIASLKSDQSEEPEQVVRVTDSDQRLREEVIGSLAEALMIDRSEISDGAEFLSLGLDSIMAVTWLRYLNQRFDINLPATTVYAHPTVGGFVEHVTVLVSSQAVPSKAPVETSPKAAVTIGTTAATQHMLVENEMSSAMVDEPIAIIGAAGRFPMAKNLDEFWENIRTGRDCISEVPSSRWDIESYFDADPQAAGKTYCKWMGALDDIQSFDARFFSITPREAELMDPQQRLFLEVAWHVIEDAGLSPAKLAGSKCGVYVAAGPSGYENLVDERNTYSLLGNSGSILASRLSHFLDLRGPSISVDTACSSSLVAIVQACESLRARTCDAVLAGGACVLVGPNMFIDTAKVSMLSKDGRCFSFDDRANGFVPGEGVGAVLLKRLSDAERDGDPIHAVIRGWGTNQDGKTNGITAPNPRAQTALLNEVYQRFDIDPATIDLIECHGTGTPLGDPIEVEGLTGAFASLTGQAECKIGSVKSNVGHLLASAGIAGVLKSMLALEYQEIPPSIHVDTLNSHISFDETPFTVSQSLEKWAAPSTNARRVGVSSFGFSGTNAHIVLEEYQTSPSAPQNHGSCLFVLSATDRERLIAYAVAVSHFVLASPDLDCNRFAYTLQTGRAFLSERVAFVFSDRDDLIEKLAAIVAGTPSDTISYTLKDDQSVALFVADDDAQALIEKWLRGDRKDHLEKIGRLWVNGVPIDWPTRPITRMHLPVYPFEKKPHWVHVPNEQDADKSISPSNVGNDLFDEQPSSGEVGRLSFRVFGNEDYLTTHANGDMRLMLGLFLPEMARAAIERVCGRTVRGLKHLMWGRPASINRTPQDLTVTVLSDPDGLMYRVAANGEEDEVWHFGSVISDVELFELEVTKAADQAISEIDVTRAYQEYAENCSIHSGPPAPTMAIVRQVFRCGDDVLAHVSIPKRTDGENKGVVFDPMVLDPVWRLIGFWSCGCVGEVGDASRHGLPLDLESIVSFAPLEGQITVHIAANAGVTGQKRLTVTCRNSNGQICLQLDDLHITDFETCRELKIAGEVST